MVAAVMPLVAGRTAVGQARRSGQLLLLRHRARMVAQRLPVHSIVEHFGERFIVCFVRTG